MIYGYIRVSTDRQTVENQRYEINEFCKKQEISIRNMYLHRFIINHSNNNDNGFKHTIY